MSLAQINPFDYFSDTNGDPLDQGYIYIGVANQDPVANPIVVYYDAAMTIPAPQPLRTVAGYISNPIAPQTFFTNQNYSVSVRDKNQVVLFYVANFSSIVSNTPFALQLAASNAWIAAFQAYTQAWGDNFIATNDAWAANYRATNEAWAAAFQANLIQRYLSFNNRGNWATGTGYAIQDLVIQGSIAYICLVAHTSGVFSTDLANGDWAIYQGVTKSDLAATNGAALIGYGAKTVAQELDLLSDVYVIANDPQFGGIDPTGTTDSTVNMAAAMAAAVAAKKVLVFRAGTYLINPLRLSAAFPVGSTYAFDLVSDLKILGYGSVTFKVIDNTSTDASPKRFNMFYGSGFGQNISFENIIFDGNGANNKISPNRGSNTYNNWNQSFIAFFGNSASGKNVRIRRCTFTGNPGVSNIICGVPNGVAVSPMGSDWEISQTLHLDCGMDSTDFSAIFGYARNVRCVNNVFINTTAPTVYNGVGARNAFEVHGEYATVEGNYIENYFGGVIVNSNWVEPVVKCSVSRNKMKNMFYYGIYIWRQPSTPLNQSFIQDIDIKDNQIELNNVLYSTATTVKAGIVGVSNFLLSISGVTISGNSVIAQASMPNASALVFLQTQAVGTTEVMDNFRVINNRCEGTYHGILFQTTASNAAKFGTLIIKGNTIRNLMNAGVNTNPIAIGVVGSAGANVVFIEENSIIDTASSQTKNGIFLSGVIGVLSVRSNTMQNVKTPLADTATVTKRLGEDDRIAEPIGTGVTVIGWKQLTRMTYTIRLDYTAWKAFGSVSGNVTTLYVPSRTRIVSVIADTTIPYAGTGITTATMQLGVSGGTASTLAVHSVTAAVTKGLADADMGSSMSKASNVQGGQLLSWTAGTSLRALLTCDANLTNLTAGSTDFHITLEGIF